MILKRRRSTKYRDEVLKKSQGSDVSLNHIRLKIVRDVINTTSLENSSLTNPAITIPQIVRILKN
jgi:hypothetical protein